MVAKGYKHTFPCWEGNLFFGALSLLVFGGGYCEDESGILGPVGHLVREKKNHPDDRTTAQRQSFIYT